MNDAVVGRRPWRLTPGQRTLLDIVIAGLLVAGSFLMLEVGTLPTVLSLAQTAPLFLRRRLPGLSFALVAAASALQTQVWEQPIWGQLAFPIALYSVGRYGTRVQGWVGLGVGIAAAFTASWVWTRSFNSDIPEEFRDALTLTSYLPFVLTIGAIVVAAWALGAQGRVREAYEAALLERGERLALEAEQRAINAAADERARIAREMHDVVAHGLSVIIVQSDGARYAAEQDPRIAVDTLETVAGAGREALTEMRRLLGLLRGTTDPALAPQPGLGDLHDLVADHRATGWGRVELSTSDPEVPAGIALTAYRIVQESLTNTRKHAGPDTTAIVDVSTREGDLVVDVVDDGRGAATPNQGSGLGLMGMRERVEVHGGTLDVGPEPGGGWAVRARIPL